MAVQKIKSGEPVVAVLLTREQALELQKQDEIKRHHWRIEDLQREYQQNLEDARRMHAQVMERIQRALAGERVPGICPTCGRDYRTFRQWDDLEQCPHCGAELGTED